MSFYLQGTQGNGAKNFDDARAACQAFAAGAELASIHFQGVQCKLSSLVLQVFKPCINHCVCGIGNEVKYFVQKEKVIQNQSLESKIFVSNFMTTKKYIILYY